MKILLSVQPKYACKILNKEKILEIRTTCPMDWRKYLDGETSIKPEPYKVYIYCTNAKSNKEGIIKIVDPLNEVKPFYAFDSFRSHTNIINGKVVAEFTLNEIDKIEICDPYIFRNNEQEDWEYFEKNACSTCEQMMEYIGYGEDHDGWDKKYDIGYAWHIDNLKIYDEPKELSEFEKYGSYKIITDCYKKQHGLCNKGYGMKGNYIGCEKARIKRPPQSWCYLEEIGE